MKMTEMVYGYYTSPIGALLVAGDDNRLHMVSFPSGSRTKQVGDDWQRDDAHFKKLFDQFSAYFGGELKHFDIELHFGGTDFQNTVWSALKEIPFGQTTSYGALASKIGRPKAVRAVGAANGANPIPIILPCHRVIGSDKSLTGFGGGVETKAFLLEHEGALPVQPRLI